MTQKTYPFKDGDYLWGVFVKASTNAQGRKVVTLAVDGRATTRDEDKRSDGKVFFDKARRYDFLIDEELTRGVADTNFSESFLSASRTGHVVGVFVENVPQSEAEPQALPMITGSEAYGPHYRKIDHVKSYAAIQAGTIARKLGLVRD